MMSLLVFRIIQTCAHKMIYPRSAQQKLCCPCRCSSTTRPWRNKRSSSLGSLSRVQKSNWRKSAKATAPSKKSAWSHIAPESPRWDVTDRYCPSSVALTTNYSKALSNCCLTGSGLRRVHRGNACLSGGSEDGRYGDRWQ